MRYKDKKPKFRNIHETSWKIKNKYTLSDLKSRRIEDNIHKLRIPSHFFKRIEVYDTGWSQISFHEVSGEYILYHSWTIEYDKVPEKLIPFIKWNILYKSDKAYTLNADIFNTNYILQVEDIETYENLKRVRITVGIISSERQNIVHPIYAKLLIAVYNPETYS